MYMCVYFINSNNFECCSYVKQNADFTLAADFFEMMPVCFLFQFNF